MDSIRIPDSRIVRIRMLNTIITIEIQILDETVKNKKNEILTLVTVVSVVYDEGTRIHSHATGFLWLICYKFDITQCFLFC